MHLHDRYQAHCRFCFRAHERDSIREAIAAAEEHERSGDCPRKPKPAVQKTISETITEGSL